MQIGQSAFETKLFLASRTGSSDAGMTLSVAAPEALHSDGRMSVSIVRLQVSFWRYDLGMTCSCADGRCSVGTTTEAENRWKPSDPNAGEI